MGMGVTGMVLSQKGLSRHSCDRRQLAIPTRRGQHLHVFWSLVVLTWCNPPYNTEWGSHSEYPRLLLSWLSHTFFSQDGLMVKNPGLVLWRCVLNPKSCHIFAVESGEVASPCSVYQFPTDKMGLRYLIGVLWSKPIHDGKVPKLTGMRAIARWTATP